MENCSLTEKNADVIARAASFPFIIWDMDGTLVDSMPCWDTLGADYLLMHGITPPSGLTELLEEMTLEESAAYFRHSLGLKQTEQEIIDGEMKLIDNEYRCTIPVKPMAAAVIKAAAQKGSRMCLLTVAERELAEAVLTRLGLAEYFETILTATELHMDKRSGAIYELAAERLGFDIEKTLICEDAPFAVRAAKETKAAVMAFREDHYTGDWEEITRIADLHEV